MLPSFDVFGLHIPMFGIMMLCGMLAAFILLWRTRRYIRFSEDTLFSAALWAIILGFIGAKVLYWIVEFDQVLADPHYLVETLRTGFVFYGALIGGVIGLIIFSARKKQPFLAFIDLFAPSLVLAQAFGRIGCFCAGCCYGCTSDSCLTVVYPAGSSAPAGIPLLPTQLFESAFLFLLTVALVWLLKKRRPYGTVTGWYLILYGVWRFFIEFYRSDDRGEVGMLSTSQFIAIFMILAGVILLLLVLRGILTKCSVPEEEIVFAEEEETEAAEEEIDAEAAVKAAVESGVIDSAEQADISADIAEAAESVVSDIRETAEAAVTAACEREALETAEAIMDDSSLSDADKLDAVADIAEADKSAKAVKKDMDKK